MRILTVFLFALLPIGATAQQADQQASQQRDSFFEDYQDYARFVDSHIMNRDFIELIQVLGGRDEYTIEQLQGINQRFVTLFPKDFLSRAVVRKTDLGDGFSQEMRVYWGNNDGYNYFYALLHAREDGLVVLTFTMNSNVSEVLSEF